MLATFVIGLREGLEAALIVGIIAAFLVRTGRRDALRNVWIGVGIALLLSLAVGVLLELISGALPQREQEMLECVVAAVAVVMVSYMVLWMKAHSRSLKADLQDAAGSALARGSAFALVVMAFLAVIREGFETAVFLLAAFQATTAPLPAAAGVLLGLTLAVTLGYLVYRGGLRLNLSRFFRITGVVLVLVAAGLVASTLRAAYEASWLTVGQQTAIDLSAFARPGSVQESLLTGMLGLRSSMPVIEVAAYLLYAIPMLAVVLWPPKRTPSRRTAGLILVGTAVAALAVAGTLALVAPAAPAPSGTAQEPVAIDGSGSSDGTAALRGTATVNPSASLSDATVAVEAGAPARLAGASATADWEGTVPVIASGYDDVAAADGSVLPVTAYSFGTPGAPVDPVSAGLPANLTADQLVELNGGRLPVGVRSDDVAGAGTAALPADYLDTWSGTVLVHAPSGTVLGLDLELTRTVQVTLPSGATVSAGTVVDATGGIDPAANAAGLAAARDAVSDRAAHQVLGQVLPGLLVVFALILLAFGLPRLLGRGRVPVAPAPPPLVASPPPPVARAPAPPVAAERSPQAAAAPEAVPRT